MLVIRNYVFSFSVPSLRVSIAHTIRYGAVVRRVTNETTETMSNRKNRCPNKREKISRVEGYLWRRARKRPSDAEHIPTEKDSGEAYAGEKERRNQEAERVSNE